jgi:hypothetical protein
MIVAIAAAGYIVEIHTRAVKNNAGEMATAKKMSDDPGSI